MDSETTLQWLLLPACCQVLASVEISFNTMYKK